MDAPRIGFLGFGEVGQRFAADLRAARRAAASSPPSTCCCTRRRPARPCGATPRRTASNSCADAAALADGSTLIFSAVTADQTLAAARVAGGTRPLARRLGGRPEFRGAADQDRVRGAGGRRRRPLRRGRRHDLGAAARHPRAHVVRRHACRARPRSCCASSASSPRRCPPSSAWPRPSSCAAASIIKGLESLVVESFTAARSLGVEQQVLASLQETYPQFDWEKQGDYLFSRVIQHGKRRAEEMRASAQMIDATGVGGIMAARGRAAPGERGRGARRRRIRRPDDLKPWRERADEMGSGCAKGTTSLRGHGSNRTRPLCAPEAP